MDLKKKHDVKYIMGNSVAENRVRQRSDSGESADESGSNEKIKSLAVYSSQKFIH